jgi:hypothetical protein
LDLSELTEKKRGKKSMWYENETGEIVAKVCSECHEVKSLEDYAKGKHGIGGRGQKCKTCRSENNKVNRERDMETNRKWREENRERLQEYYRKWRESNQNYSTEYNRNWRDANPDKHALTHQRRRARKASLPDTLTNDQTKAILDRFNGRCALTGDSNVHLDHVIPLATGYGGTIYGNIIPLRADLNISKNDHNIFNWFSENKERFNLSQQRFDEIIEYLAQTNEMIPEEYRVFVYQCHEHKRVI